MINLITKILSLIERLLDWLAGRKETRKRNEVRKAVVEHDREALNRIIQERRDKQ